MQKSAIWLSQCLNISLIFTALLFLLPFVNLYHTYPIETLYAEWLAGILGISASFALLHPAILAHLKIPRISIVFLGITLIVALQWLVGMLPSAQYALLIISYLLWAFLLSILGSQLRIRLGWEKLAITFAWFLMVGGIINAGIVVLQIVVRTGGIVTFLPNFISFGAIPQPNHFANFIALATISLIYLYMKRRFSITFFSLMLAWFLMALSFSGSRSPWLYLLVMVCLAFIMHKNMSSNNDNSNRTVILLRITLLALPTFALVQLVIHFLAPDGLTWSTTARLAELAARDTPSARVQIWYDSLRLFLQSPWLGVGFGSMTFESFLLLDSPTPWATKHMFEHAHNLFVHLLAEMGVFAFLIVCLSLFMWIKAFKWHALSLETWWLTALLGVLGIHSMLEYPLWYAYFLGIAAILFGAGDEKLIAFNINKPANATTSRLNINLTRVLFTIMLVAGSFNLVTMLVANFKLERSLYVFGSLDKNKQQELDWVRNYSLLAPYADLIQAIKMKIDTKDIQSQYLLNKSALTFRPFRKVAYQHVMLLELKGNHIEAIKLLKRTLIIYPYKARYLEEYIPSQFKQNFLLLLTEANPNFLNPV